MDDRKWMNGITSNFAEFVRDLKNADDVAEHLHSECTPELIREDELEEISKIPLQQKKTRKILSLLVARGHRALPELYNAFIQTKNSHLAERMANDVQLYEKQITKIPEKQNPEWPPDQATLLQMNKDEVIKCNIKSPSLIGPYYNKKYIYDMSSRNRGRVIIINNMFHDKKKAVFKDSNGELKRLSYRKGSDKDCESLKTVFVQLHFEVEVKNELEGEAMKKLAESESKHKGHESAKCFVFIVLSHGSAAGVFGVDGTTVQVEELARHFDSSNCPHLTNKPKIFIFQACRGVQDELSVGAGTAAQSDDVEDVSSSVKAVGVTELDAVGRRNPQTQANTGGVFSKADFLYAYATAAGYKAYRSTYRGSWFIQALVWLLKYESHQEHLTDILTKVNSLVSMGKAETGSGSHYTAVSNYETSLRRKLYFFPGVCDYPPKEIK